jgi:CheY-like chemotaxis protein
VSALASEIDQWLKSFAPKRNDGFRDGSGRKTQSIDGMARVLVVDDTETTLYLMERQLQHLGYKVMTALTGRVALELASTYADIVLLDLNLPEMHGLEVLRRLRTTLNTSHIPVICTSATYAPEGAAPVALQLGAKRFLSHPISPDALHNAIQDVLVWTAQTDQAAPATYTDGESISITS